MMEEQILAIIFQAVKNLQVDIGAINDAVAALNIAITNLQTSVNALGPQVQAIDSDLRPNAPLAPTLTPGTQQITVAWNAVPGAQSYNIYWSSSLAGPFFSISVNNTYVLSGLATGTTYYFYITAVNRAGESQPGPTVSATAQ